MEWYVFAFIAAVLTAASAITQKKALLKEHAMEFSATLAMIIMVMSLPLLLLIDYTRLQLFPIIIIFFGALLGALAFLMVAKAIRHMEVSASSPLLVLGTAFSAVFAYIFLGETLTHYQIGGICLLIFGAYVLETKKHHGLLEPFRVFKKSKYIHYIAFALVLYGLCGVIDRTVLGVYKMQPEAFIVFAHFFIALHFLIIISIFHDGVKDIKHGLKNSGWWMFLVAVLTLGYRLSQAEAISVAKIGLVSAIKRMSALFAVLIGGELFHEKNLMRKSLACLIMIGGAALIVI